MYTPRPPPAGQYITRLRPYVPLVPPPPPPCPSKTVDSSARPRPACGCSPSLSSFCPLRAPALPVRICRQQDMGVRGDDGVAQAAVLVVAIPGPHRSTFAARHTSFLVGGCDGQDWGCCLQHTTTVVSSRTSESPRNECWGNLRQRTDSGQIEVFHGRRG